MIVKWVKSIDQYYILKYIIKWFFLILPVSIVVGSMVALFLWLLNIATILRWENMWLIYFLPFIGIGIVALYKFKGKNSEAGNNLVMDEIHKPGGGIPMRMAPFVLITTVLTHLFGGSAGREGTAVQIGGSVANFFGKLFHLNPEDLKILLMTGIAAGFGSVFGTPIAGTIFALEVLVIGRIKYDALLPCLLAAILADIVCTMWGIHHTLYHIGFHEQANTSFFNFKFDPQILVWVIVSAVIFGLISNVFSELTQFIKNSSHKYIKNKFVIPFIGGIVILILTATLNTTDYLGLGVTTQNGTGNSIVNAFKTDGVDSLAWLWKIIFTVVTLSTGFKGGEVTPLFFIGAALGNSIATFADMPVDLFAALGFIAVFAGATNTPLACTIMGAELFGSEHIIYFAMACFIAYYFSGHSGIYTSQRVKISKGNRLHFTDSKTTLKKIANQNKN